MVKISPPVRGAASMIEDPFGMIFPFKKVPFEIVMFSMMSVDSSE